MEAEAEAEAEKYFWMEAEAEAEAKTILKMEAEAEAVQKLGASTSLHLGFDTYFLFKHKIQTSWSNSMKLAAYCL